MRISIERAADKTFIVEVPCKPKKDKKGNMENWKPDLKYTAKTEEEALDIVKEALKEIETPEDEYGLAFDSASKPEESKEK
jgi:hypothetical protein